MITVRGGQGGYRYDEPQLMSVALDSKKYGGHWEHMSYWQLNLFTLLSQYNTHPIDNPRYDDTKPSPGRIYDKDRANDKDDKEKSTVVCIR
jgi:hypothetical protein